MKNLAIFGRYKEKRNRNYVQPIIPHSLNKHPIIMKKITTFILVLCFPLLTIAQITFDLKGTINKKISSNLPEGQNIELKSITYYESIGFYKASIYVDGKEELVEVKTLDRISFSPTNSKEFWQNQALSHDVYKNIMKNGMQYDLRKELEEEAIDYINYTESNNLIFKDSYLESYLYALAYRIYPTQIDDGRPGVLNVKILKSTVPNAFIFPNGTMFLSTGLLSTINTEEELIGIMAHEISHFVLDHSIININVAEQRKKRAEFWAAFATGLAAAADMYTASNSDYYAPGAITIGTAILAYSIVAELNERMGLKYSREQEMEADECAAKLMEYINVSPKALSSALLKIKDYSILNGNYLALTGTGTHPAIDDRINKLGLPLTGFHSPDYDKTISFVNSFNAIVQFNSHHLRSCSKLVNRNIEAGIATEDDYILLAMVTTFMYDNEEKNYEALSYIKKAKTLNISPSINIHKQEAIILIRLEKYDEAKTVLNKYLNALESEQSKLGNIKNSSEWSYASNFIFNEQEWTVKMINKVDKM